MCIRIFCFDCNLYCDGVNVLALRRNVLSFGERDEEVEREKKEEREGGRRMFKFVWNFVVPTF